MSVAIAVHAGRFVLLGADCREWVYSDPSMATVTRLRLRQKIDDVGTGFVTGIGAPALIDDVTERIAAAPPEALEDLDELNADARAAFATEAAGAFLEHALEKTSWFYSFDGQDEFGAPIVGLLLALGKLDLRLLSPGRVYPLMRAASYATHADRVADTMRAMADEDLDDAIARAAALVRALIRDYAGEPGDDRGPFCSAECTLAVHAPGDRRLSRVLAPDDVLTWQAVESAIRTGAA